VIQGEGGLASMTRDFAEALNEVSRTLDIILIADEVQTGLGRTGYFYASEYVGMKPDIVTIAKPLAAGLPLSATLIPSKVNELLHAGDHGSTFGGGAGYLCCGRPYRGPDLTSRFPRRGA
jgi:acetylornithine/N-succinyldiaminopimelate aminotransferase